MCLCVHIDLGMVATENYLSRRQNVCRVADPGGRPRAIQGCGRKKSKCLLGGKVVGSDGDVYPVIKGSKWGGVELWLLRPVAGGTLGT